MEQVIKYTGLFWKEVKSIYTLYLMFLTVGAGIYEFIYDGYNFKKAGLKKEEMLARATGAGYFIGAVVLFILVKLI